MENQMDLVGAISNLQTSKALGEVQLRVARKILDDQKLQGAAALKLIQAADQGVGKATEAVAAQANALGGMLDVRA
jgi:hypothetical protein